MWHRHELIKINYAQARFPWPGDTTQPKQFAEGTQLAFGIKASRAVVLGINPQTSLPSVGLCGAHFSVQQVQRWGKMSPHMCLGYLPGHPFSLHNLERRLAPSQSAPPNAGAGLVHDRRDIWLPPPHDTEHGSHSLHSVHLPSTAHSVILVLVKITFLGHEKVSKH